MKTSIGLKTDKTAADHKVANMPQFICPAMNESGARVSGPLEADNGVGAPSAPEALQTVAHGVSRGLGSHFDQAPPGAAEVRPKLKVPSLSPLPGLAAFGWLPTAHAVGYSLSPLCGCRFAELLWSRWLGRLAR